MIAEDYFNSEEIINKINKRIDTYKEWNNKRIDIYKDWNYKNINKLKIYRVISNRDGTREVFRKIKAVIPTEESVIAVEPNETSEITFVSLIIDLFSITNTSIDFYFRYTPCDSALLSNDPLISSFDLNKKSSHYLIHDKYKYVCPINKSIKLSELTLECSYKDIRAFFIVLLLRIPDDLSINHKEINCTLTVRYTQQN